jgi:hypothetical protein
MRKACLRANGDDDGVAAAMTLTSTRVTNDNQYLQLIHLKKNFVGSFNARIEIELQIEI